MIAEIEDSPYSKTYTAPDGNTAEYRSFKKWQAGKLASGNIAVVNTVQTRYNIGEKYSNIEVREFYISQIEQIQNSIDRTLPLEEQARSAFNQRNEIRTYARDLMNDEKTRKKLDEGHPNPSFDELIERKMKKKGLSREAALKDIIKTASVSNDDVNKMLGV